MMNEIAVTMKSWADYNHGDTPRKMHIYSGNDISVGFVLEFFNAISEMPEFGASVHFHLYHDEKFGYFVKVCLACNL